MVLKPFWVEEFCSKEHKLSLTQKEKCDEKLSRLFGNRPSDDSDLALDNNRGELIRFPGD